MLITKNNVSALTCLFLGVIFLIGCSEKIPSSLSGISDIDASDDMINSKVTLSILSDNNIVKNNDSIWLSLDNISNDTIEFQPDFGIRVFVYEDKKWIEIKNNVEYLLPESSTYTFTPSNNDPFKTQSLTIAPYYSELKHTLPCRIIVSGRIISNDANDKKITYSYIDITIKP